MLAGFLESMVPKQYTLLGQRLLPYSLGHNILLTASRNGFATGADAHYEDLIHGVFICCQTWEENQEALRDPDLVAKLERWGEAIGLFDAEVKGKQFAEYVVWGSGLPEMLPAEDEARAMGSSFDQRLLLFLIQQLRLSYSQALNFPYGQARHHYFAWHEVEGRAKIANEEERLQLSEHEQCLKDPEFLQACLDALGPNAVLLYGDAGEPAKKKKKGRARKKKGRK